MHQPNLKKLFTHTICEEEKKIQSAMTLVLAEKKFCHKGSEL